MRILPAAITNLFRSTTTRNSTTSPQPKSAKIKPGSIRLEGNNVTELPAVKNPTSGRSGAASSSIGKVALPVSWTGGVLPAKEVRMEHALCCALRSWLARGPGDLQDFQPYWETTCLVFQMDSNILNASTEMSQGLRKSAAEFMDTSEIDQELEEDITPSADPINDTDGDVNEVDDGMYEIDIETKLKSVYFSAVLDVFRVGSSESFVANIEKNFNDSFPEFRVSSSENLKKNNAAEDFVKIVFNVLWPDERKPVAGTQGGETSDPEIDALERRLRALNTGAGPDTGHDTDQADFDELEREFVQTVAPPTDNRDPSDRALKDMKAGTGDGLAGIQGDVLIVGDLTDLREPEANHRQQSND